jgi:predicted RNA-binding Zn ribbon-like protein
MVATQNITIKIVFISGQEDLLMISSDVRILVPGRADKVEITGGALCLDFVNTVEPRVQPSDGTVPQDYLTGYTDLLMWSQHAGVLNAVEAVGLQAESIREMQLAQETLEQALMLREVLYDIFFAIAQQRRIDPAALEMLRGAYAEAMQQARFVPREDTFEIEWIEQPVHLMRPLWPVVYSAVELLMRGEHKRIKDCETGGEGCGWLFYDTSKNTSRRWCSMQSCGAEAKERRRGKRQARS